MLGLLVEPSVTVMNATEIVNLVLRLAPTSATASPLTASADATDLDAEGLNVWQAWLG